MKRKLQFFIAIFLLIPGLPILASLPNLNSVVGDKVVLLTDRTLYIAGERIMFHAVLCHPQSVADSLKSQVIYCELITPDGNKIYSGKYRVHEYSASGYTQIPTDIHTGTYYLRAYTKQQRNYVPGYYAYKQIKIINPKSEDVLSANSNTVETNPVMKEAKYGALDAFVSLELNKLEYLSGDTIKVSLQRKVNSDQNLQSISLKIIPENTSLGLQLIPDGTEVLAGKEYFAETRGLSLNGKLTLTESTFPVGGKRVNLSIIGDGRDFMATTSDTAGRFFFALPDYYGKRDLFICSEKTHSSELKIWIDNDFCTKPVNLSSPKFTLSNQERKIAQKMAINTQISSRFASELAAPVQNKVSESVAFYGKPTTVLLLDQYIQLPTLEECFNELPSSVKVRKQQGEKYFKVMGKRDLSFYPPLVLVDWVAVDEPEKILAVSPNAVSRIEIVNEIYVKGEQTYGGIISIISKRGDFAGIDLPSTGVFVNYTFLNDTLNLKDYMNDLPEFPDTRNTLLWKPGIAVKNMDNELFNVKLPDTPWTYCIILEGITKTGEILILEKKIVVKK